MLKRTISGAILVAIMLVMIDLNAKTYLVLWAVLAFMTLVEYIGLTLQYGQKLGRRWPLISALGGFYILLSYIVLMFGFGLQEHNRMMVITMLTMIWANDIGAYLLGSAIGKHKMAPKISPKKSWEGFAGGLISAVGVGLLWQWLFWSRIATPVELLFVDQWLFFALMGLVAALGAVGGDLLESFFKRRIGIKDSGSIIPGHGGMLDRFDALLLAAPLVWLYMLLFV